jgi:hypothetical protein
MEGTHTEYGFNIVFDFDETMISHKAPTMFGRPSEILEYVRPKAK